MLHAWSTFLSLQKNEETFLSVNIRNIAIKERVHIWLTGKPGDRHLKTHGSRPGESLTVHQPGQKEEQHISWSHRTRDAWTKNTVWLNLEEELHVSVLGPFRSRPEATVNQWEMFCDYVSQLPQSSWDDCEVSNSDSQTGHSRIVSWLLKWSLTH